MIARRSPLASSKARPSSARSSSARSSSARPSSARPSSARRTASFALVAALGAAALTHSACVTSSEPQSCNEEPIYAGLATDEAWRVMVDAQGRATADGANAPVIETPSDAQVLSSTEDAPTLRWTSKLQVMLTPAPGDASYSGARRPTSPFDVLTEMLIPTAHAHLPPITGDVYFVELDIPGRPCPWGILTTNLDYPLDGETWAQLQAVPGQTITMNITSAYLTENRITEGPFKAAPRTFVVGKTAAR